MNAVDLLHLFNAFDQGVDACRRGDEATIQRCIDRLNKINQEKTPVAAGVELNRLSKGDTA